MKAALLFLLLVAACGSSAAPNAPSPLVGTWTFGPSSKNTISLTVAKSGCRVMIDPTNNFIPPTPLAGVSVRVTQVGSNLDLDVGCRCHIVMTVSGRHAKAIPNPQQTCYLVSNRY